MSNKPTSWKCCRAKRCCNNPPGYELKGEPASKDADKSDALESSALDDGATKKDSTLKGSNKTIKAMDVVYIKNRVPRVCTIKDCNSYKTCNSHQQSPTDSHRSCQARVDRGSSPITIPDSQDQFMCRSCKLNSRLEKKNTSPRPVRESPCSCPKLSTRSSSRICKRCCGCSKSDKESCCSGSFRRMRQHRGTSTTPCVRVSRATMCLSRSSSRRSLHDQCTTTRVGSCHSCVSKHIFYLLTFVDFWKRK